MDGQYNLELPIPLLPDAASHPISPGAVAEGSGTFAGSLHRNIINCGYADMIALIVSDSVTGVYVFCRLLHREGAPRCSSRPQESSGRHCGVVAKAQNWWLAIWLRLQQRQVARNRADN